MFWFLLPAPLVHLRPTTLSAPQTQRPQYISDPVSLASECGQKVEEILVLLVKSRSDFCKLVAHAAGAKGLRMSTSALGKLFFVLWCSLL